MLKFFFPSKKKIVPKKNSKKIDNIKKSKDIQKEKKIEKIEKKEIKNISKPIQQEPKTVNEALMKLSKVIQLNAEIIKERNDMIIKERNEMILRNKVKTD